MGRPARHLAVLPSPERFPLCGARQIIITHHDPLRTDNELLGIEADLRQQHPDLQIIIAREQVVYTV